MLFLNFVNIILDFLQFGRIYTARMSQHDKIPIWWEVFVTEYLKDGNASRSYQVARPKTKGNVAEAAASRLLRHVKFASYLQLQRDKLTKKQEMTREEWLRINAEMARCDIRDFLEEDDIGDITLSKDWKTKKNGAALEAIETQTVTLESGAVVRKVKLKRESKAKALENIGKALDFIADKHELKADIHITAEDVIDAWKKEISPKAVEERLSDSKPI